MSEALFKEVRYTLGILVSDIILGHIGLTYDGYLATRRPLIAAVIRDGYKKLGECST